MGGGMCMINSAFKELVQMQVGDWETVCSTQQTPTKSRVGGPVPHRVHELVQVDEWRDGNNGQGRKRCQRTCKVCSKLKRSDGPKGGETSYYCRACKLPTSSKKPLAARVYLCNKIKHKVDGRELSCYDIWHTSWRNGTNIPPSVKNNRIRARTPGSSTGAGGSTDGSDVNRQHKKHQRVETTS
ncbi:hypothetical protein F444_01646 [Phytophthora nicotianae P1976]|uniref:PiggyBac transposable element-derived protein 4 C-terminal zinc-ribbon domain-containing protein n=1 Tax=Phytophthora nicotianae P1976 TaxID=1317066 RepID=A0A081AZZ5_PHYNI|nr:hypothetical protein F444_01646 [Phytophthora nicotianae P1976]